jgi:hypothetical protein
LRLPGHFESSPPTPKCDTPQSFEEFNESEAKEALLEVDVHQVLPSEKSTDQFHVSLPYTTLLQPQECAKEEEYPKLQKKLERKRGKYRIRKRSQCDSEEREVQRLERNRKSAKESRVRKKQYITQLEQEVKTSNYRIGKTT